jgi:hypothetical protein
MKTLRKPLIGLFTVLGITFTASVMAADITSRTEYKQDLNTAESNYQSAYDACGSSSGSERIECRRQALANWDTAKADAREAHGLPRHAQGPRN